MKMMSKNLACAVIAVCSLTAGSPATAQQRVWEGNSLPMFFDSLGGRHYATYGYYGQLDPALACISNERAVASGRASARTDKRATEGAIGYTLVCTDGSRQDGLPAALARRKAISNLRSDGMGEKK
jgi:hypothetical protein